MIRRNDLGKVMNFVASRWVAESRDPDSKLMADLPSDFWMNSVGGKTANGGFWVTTLMYTENEADAAAFREVLLRWQSKGSSSRNGISAAANGGGGHGGHNGRRGGSSGPNLVQISKMRDSKSRGMDADDGKADGDSSQS